MIEKSCTAWALALALLAPVVAAAQEGERPSVQEVRAIRLDASSIRLDGVPDEPVWQQAAIVRGLTSFDPVDGQAPAGQMTAWIFYDADAIYIAARIGLPPGAMRGRLAPRENVDNDDLFEVMLDPFLDRRTGYDFTVNPYGVQVDWTVADDDFSSAWDGVWDSAASRRADGFSVEMRIPFSTLRFSSAAVQDWGIGLGFFSGAKKQYDKWPAMSPSRGTIFAQLGVWRGLSGIHRSNNLDVIPTLMTGYGGSNAGGGFAWDKPVLLRAREPGIVDLGLDLRYGITPSTNLNIAINPDFSQVEADTDQLQYNLRYPVLLDEKRPFFLEGASIFNTPVSLLYTRAIVDPIAGLKLSGRDGSWSFGLFSMWDQLPLASRVVEPTRASGFEDLTGKDAVSTVGRVSLDLGGGSRIGLFAADKTVRDSTTGSFAARNDVVAADALLTFASIYTVIAQVSGSYSDRAGSGDEAFSGLSYDFTARRRDRNFFVELSSQYYSEGFRAETSPITRVNVIPSTATATYRIYTGLPALPYVESGVQLGTVHQASTRELLDTTVKPSVTARVGKNTDLSVSFSRGDETYTRRFDGIDQWNASVTSYPWNFLSVATTFVVGDQINYDPANAYLGKIVQGSVGGTIKPTRNTELKVNYTRSQLSQPGDLRPKSVDLYYTKLGVAFSTRLSLRVIAQLDTYERSLLNSATLAYQIYPGTELFVGYQESDDVAVYTQPLDRRLFMKWSYRWHR